MKYIKLLLDLYALKSNTKKNIQDIRKIQETKLRRMLRYAYNNSAYYRHTFEASGITSENLDTVQLSDFPTIDKSQLLANFDNLITVEDLTQEEIRRFDTEEKANRKALKEKYHVVHSSGSTGKPGYFVYDEDAWNSMLLGVLRAALWNMSMPQILKLLISGPHIAYIAATDGRYGGAMAVGDGIAGVGAKQIHLDVKSPLSEWIRQIQLFKPNIIIGYPSAIKILGELVEKGEVSVNVLRVISCGESLGTSLRHYLEKIFHTQIINIYGASESLAIGVETDPNEGMILFDDMNVIEIEDGAMYLTSLYNFTQPLIRYQISDNLSLQKPNKNSLYPFTKAAHLLGRNEDMIWFEDTSGNREFLHPLAIEGFCIEGLLDYQFQQTGKDVLEMQAQISQTASEEVICAEMLSQMRGMLEEKNLTYVQFYVNFVDEIFPDPQTGKKRLIVKQTVIERTAG